MWSDAVYRLVKVRFEVWPADHSRLMWRPSVIDWWNNAWYWRDCVQHSSLFHSDWNSWSEQFWRQLRSIDVFQHVNVELNAIFGPLWRERHRVGGGSVKSSNLFSESALNSTARRLFLNHLRRREQLSRVTTIYRRPSTVDPERHSTWSTEPARRFVVGSLPDTTTRSCEEVVLFFQTGSSYSSDVD